MQSWQEILGEWCGILDRGSDQGIQAAGVHLVCFVDLVYLVHLVSPISLIQPNKPNRPNEQDRLNPFSLST
jgi:hypothetical protein